MFISKKDFEDLKKKVEHQEQVIHILSYDMVRLQQELNELKNPKEPNYFD
jgi:glycerol-3-phosphate responsive antiterminator